MIRFVDGFDVCEYNQVALKYEGYDQGFDQGFVTGGRDGAGNSMEILNTGFGEVSYTKILDPQSRWGFHADVQFAGSHFATVDWYLIAAVDPGTGAVVPILTLRILPSGLMSIMQSATGVAIATTSTPITANAWHTIEFRCDFPGQAVLKIDGTQAASGSVGSGVALPSRLTFRWQVFGPPSIIVDNYVIFDGQGSSFTDFLGRVRVTSLLPTADVQTAWTPSAGAGAYAKVNDAFGTPHGAPDGDWGYISPASAADQLFDVQPSPCFGLNFAVAANVCARPGSGDQSLSVICQLSRTRQVLGTVTFTPVGQVNPNADAALTNYFTQQVIAEENPDTGDVWIDAQITNAWFGLRALTANQPIRVSAFYLEKVTSLAGLPYTCGGGSYAFTGP